MWQGKKVGKTITQRFLIYCVLFLVAVVHIDALFGKPLFAYTGRRSSSSGQREHLGWCVYPVMQTLSCYSGRHCCCPCTCATCCGSCWGAFREQCVLMVSPNHFSFTPWTCSWESCSSRLRFYFHHVHFWMVAEGHTFHGMMEYERQVQEHCAYDLCGFAQATSNCPVASSPDA